MDSELLELQFCAVLFYQRSFIYIGVSQKKDEAPLFLWCFETTHVSREEWKKKEGTIMKDGNDIAAATAAARLLTNYLVMAKYSVLA